MSDRTQRVAPSIAPRPDRGGATRCGPAAASPCPPPSRAPTPAYTRAVLRGNRARQRVT
ncbi:MAG: hypothetical protein AVDCRST_MAG59-2943 [uncultured Thermomicrobiales bacterium]|uniref:Uncharacterized protein n=1 Tax=uncultured Thermomicrobiales bacterium TaxID=1645740 RepID=A0A6J4V2M5_9BACT|nr:MAG: hypothetical protein AVDCRST_MAG59-2943 [uncultured Thermomicrobiales bacterium]